MKICFGTSLVVAGVLAATGTAFGQVAGDECTNAITAVDGPNAGYSTATATPSANPPADETCNFLDWGASKDLWFVYNAAGAGLLDLDFCTSGYDTSIVVYSGSCASLTRIACDDDSCPGGTAFQSFKTGISVGAAGPIFIRVGGWNAASGAVSFNLTLNAASEGCVGATGGCGVAHGGLGCNDPVCCSAVCSANPLCCELAWDSTCVQTAVAVCGIFVYNCNQGTPGNDCAINATLVSANGSYPFSSVGALTDGPPATPGATCASGSDLFDNDVWFKFQAAANGLLTVSSCGSSSYDNKLAVYDAGTSIAAYNYNNLPTSLVGCNDDGSASCYITGTATPYASAVSVSVNVGHWYLVRNGSFTSGDTGNGLLTFTLPAPCALPAPTSSESEACGAATNEGCNDAGGTNPTEPISLGSTIGGTFWADADTRDTDWYSLTLAADTEVTLNLFSASFSNAFLVTGDCTTIIAGTTPGCPATVTTCAPAGTYFVVVLTDAFTGNPCGNGLFNQYRINVTGVPTVCPPSSDLCDNSGPDTTTQSNSPDLTVGGVACAAGGITVANSFARSFPGLTSGELRCVEFGYANDGSPVAASLIVYRDTNGGAPGAPGDDLVELARRDLVPLTAGGMVTARFEEPICLDGNTQNIVVVLDIAASTSGFAVYNGNELGSTAPTYILSAGCGINAFTDVASIDFGNLQWVVTLNGDYSACGGGGTPCPTDIDNNGSTDAADLAALLGQWGQAGGSADFNGGGVDASDLAVLLGAWGACL